MSAYATSTSHYLFESQPRWGGQVGSGGVSSTSSTTVPLASTTNLTNGRAYIWVANRVDSSGTKQNTWETGIGVLSGSNLTNCTRAVEGTAGAWPAGTVVEILMTSTHWNKMIDFLGTEHNADGTHSAVTADSITLASGATPTEFSTDTTLAGNSDTAIPTEKAIKTYVDGEIAGVGTGLITDTAYAPEGFLINGKLSVSVTSSNLTVAIKGLDGNDPSSSNKVYVRIGNTVHTLTAALSVTKNAGTNWMALGDAKIATNEVDLFVYLGYNATDGVVIGFSRICHAIKYSDFSATSTNDRYAAISTITNAASTDEYTVIGRFNAILSASASFNWSIPATAVVINRPIYETRRLTYTNAYTGWVSVTGTVYYQIVGSRCLLFTTESVGGTSNATTKTMRLPISIGVTGIDFSWVGAFIQDNTSWQQYPGHIRIEIGATDTVKIGKTVHLSAWTASGTATFGLMGFYFPL